jgi:hypothetical protein
MAQGKTDGEDYLRARACIRLTTLFRRHWLMDPFFTFFETKFVFYGLGIVFCVILCVHMRCCFFVQILLAFFRTRASPKGVNVAIPP